MAQVTSSISPAASQRSGFSTFLRTYTVSLCALAAVFTAIIPFARAFFHLEITYNEGWNIYNAERVLHHQLLYPVKYGWTMVNYPALSFYLMAGLHHFTHEFLFTARVVSLLSVIAIGVLAGAIVRTLDASPRASILTGLFTFAVFCANADFYVGMDDPQLLANAVFLLGFLLYLRNRRNPAALILAALIFVIGGCIKQTPIDFPLAALVDLALLSVPLALLFVLCLGAFAVAAILLNIHFGGPFFFAEFFAPRHYSVLHILESFRDVFAPIPILFCFSVYVAWRLRKDPRRRVVPVLFALSVVIGGFFSGGYGVSINGLFSPMIAMCLLLGLACDPALLLVLKWSSRWAAYIPLMMFAWLIIPLILSGNIDVIGTLRQLLQSQVRFQQGVALLASRPGPALCESLLECYAAGKPYVYDPFNATRLIDFGKLNDSVIIDQLQRQQFAFVQLDRLTDNHAYSERFTPAIYNAIVQNYTPILKQPDNIVYVPKTISPTAAIAP